MNAKEKEKYIEEFNFPHCDESSKYEKVAKIGQGTFGYVSFFSLKSRNYVLIYVYFNFFREVFKARDKKTSKKFVAMKKVLMDNEKEGVSIIMIVKYFIRNFLFINLEFVTSLKNIYN